MEKESPELLVTITFRVAHTDLCTVGDQVEPVMRSAMAIGGKTTHVDISVYEKER
jgi:hypothetical protein